MAMLVALLAVCVALLLLSAEARAALRRAVKGAATVARVVYLTRGVPSPPSLPLVGCVPTLFALFRDPRAALTDLIDKYGKTVRLHLVNRVLIVAMDPDDVQAVCTHPALASKPELYADLLGPHMGVGLVNINGPTHRRHRKAITPSLHFDILSDFVPIFVRNSEILVARLAERADGDSFDIQAEFGRLTSTTFIQTVLSSREATAADIGKDSAVLYEASHLMMWRAMRPWWYHDTVFKLFSDQAEPFFRTSETMNRMVSRVLTDKTAEVARGEAPPPRRRMSFLDHVLRSKEGGLLSSDELREELKTFLFVGASTSMDYLSLMAYILSYFPDVQRKVQEELDGVFGRPGTAGADRPLVADDLPHLEYTERVLREVLRYAPPIPIIFRVASEDMTLPTGTFVPEGCFVGVVPAGTHRLQEHFDEPWAFDPDRFLPERTRGRHPYAYVPFSAGARNCIGLRYALMLAKTVTASVLRRFTILRAADSPETLEDVKFDFSLTMSVRGRANVRLQSRLVAAA
ncbi:Cytochrome P450 CYP4 [Frankliniella occidentalis]|uniref:Cytochrome P450 4C1-like n=1 Tax=Frankliniella occidentalis TaxID=133901 RepID=A0A6J1SCG7_FRAOC|nr:cytochrome P450 4C1-like [Frankliniella occidentalis]KAE8749447.1 Cytochrome P450 CYP4 [Frankliniella occidentalis]